MDIKYNPSSKQELLQKLIRSLMASSCLVLKNFQVGDLTALLGNALQLSLRGVTSAGILQLVLAVYCLFMAYPDPVLFKTSL